MPYIPCMYVFYLSRRCVNIRSYKNLWKLQSGDYAIRSISALFYEVRGEDKAEEILSKIGNEVTRSPRALNLNFNLPAAEGAFFSSFEDNYEGGCLQIRGLTFFTKLQWASSPHSKCMFWLNGVTGIGKSTIARTVAQDLEAKAQPVASFSFKKGEADRGSAKRLMPTLSRQLMKVNWQFADDLTKIIERDSDILAKSLRE